MRIFYRVIIISVVLCAAAPRIFGQVAGVSEAQKIADNWPQMIIDKYGGWNGSATVKADSVKELFFEGRMIGYYSNVSPSGYVIISLRKELSPVKACSEKGSFDPQKYDQLSGLIMYRMSKIIDTIQSEFGEISHASGSSIRSMTDEDYSSKWDYIMGYQKGALSGSLERRNNTIGGNYREGDYLLDTYWRQAGPYNSACDYADCSDPKNGRVLVGCVATAMSQIMKYWSWPPYGVTSPYNDYYDWVNMPLDFNTKYPTAYLASDPAVKAVAELSHEAGLAVGMDYGCDESIAGIYGTQDAFEDNFRYAAGTDVVHREFHSQASWFEMIKAEINYNRPVFHTLGWYNFPLSINGHAIVCDGWREVTPGIKEYHMNYAGDFGSGSDSLNTSWYKVDEMPQASNSYDMILRYVKPNVALGPTLSFTYAPTATLFRYFDVDASGTEATFQSGQLLQLLPRVTVKGTGTSTYVRFNGSASHTRLFVNGDQSRGIKIGSGTVRLINNGSFKLSERPIATKPVLVLGSNQAMLGGDIYDDGGSAIVTRGVCWGTTREPTISGNKVVSGAGSNSFIVDINDLLPGTTYYARAYCANGLGTAYGNEVSFTTSAQVTDVESNIYNTITLGGKTWMKENLKTTKFNDGSSVPLVADSVTWINLTAPGFCWYKNDAVTYKNLYGALYNSFAVNTGKLCPTGWHVSTDAEWTELADLLDNSYVGEYLKSRNGWELSGDWNGKDLVGFSALPGGVRGDNGGFFAGGGNGFWWTSTQYFINNFYRVIYGAGNGFDRYQGLLEGHSVRCVKN